MLMIVAAVSLLTACGTKKNNENRSSIPEKTIQATIDSIIAKSSNTDTNLLNKGVRNAAGFWKKEDGTSEAFQNYCIDHFLSSPEAKAKLFETVQKNLEIINGHYNLINLGLKKPVQEVGEDYTAIDEDFGALDPYAHFTDDLFQSKIAFSILLNFPFYSLQEKKVLGKEWSRQEWAYARMGDLLTSRIPAERNQKVSKALAESEIYISNYNVWMNGLRTEDNRQLFKDSIALIAHWGLRDELKADYADKKDGLEKQQLIYEVMKRIIDQSIPETVINIGDVVWKPISNKVNDADAKPEPDTRYKRLLANYHEMKALDPYCKSYPTALARAFDRDMEVSVADIETIFTTLLSSPEVASVSKLIKKRLGRNLKPFDIWYDGFKSRSSIPEQEMSVKTRQLYPTTQAFEKGMPAILGKLGFEPKDAREISALVTVDNARGSGHAWGAQSRGDKSHLRTRLQSGGMEYKGYNIALHEFGHNVEQTISMNRVDNYIMNGIPSTAFTEALAFVFQKRDLEVLGYKNSDPNKQALQTLDIFWGCYEIMGVSLVEIRTWKWLYENPNATAERLKENVIKNAKDIWNQYYATYLGEKDATILAIYSHMIEFPLYLSNYPYGHIVEFQLEKHFGNTLPGKEIQRIYPIGRVCPDVWMRHAVGETVSVNPMLEATSAAVQAVH